MLRSNYRSAYVVGLALGLGLAPVAAGDARADTPPESDVKASMQCDRANEPGRVRCTVEARIEGGRTLAWADVELLSLPEFASALKGRIGPQDALSRDATSTKWALGLVARRSGQGEARARVRVVACEAARSGPEERADAGPAPAPRCVPVTVVVKAQLSVGG
jgi:hypothetical protein